MKKIPVASRKKAPSKQKAPSPAKAAKKPAKTSKTKPKGQKKRASTVDKDRERIGQKLTERAMRNYR
jgi:hypothetical protein